MELTKQNYYQCVEDMGRIWLDIMSVRYGERMVETTMEMDDIGDQPLGMQIPRQTFMQNFDFEQLKGMQMAIRQDVGASSYWSEMASMQTLDNLLMNHLITPKQYIERLPNGYLSKKQELLAELTAQEAAQAAAQAAMSAQRGTGMSTETTSENIAVQGGSGNGSLQRALNREGA